MHPVMRGRARKTKLIHEAFLEGHSNRPLLGKNSPAKGNVHIAQLKSARQKVCQYDQEREILSLATGETDLISFSAQICQYNSLAEVTLL